MSKQKWMKVLFYITIPLVAFAEQDKSNFERFKIKPEMKEYYKGYLEYKKGNYHKALPIFKRYCNTGIAAACLVLGEMYRYGRGVSIDYKKAFELYSKACNKRIDIACDKLGDMYKYGYGVKQNLKEAIRLYTKSCELGSFFTCERLGRMYEKGSEVNRNLEKALLFYSKACDMRRDFNMKYNTSCEKVKMSRETPSIFGLRIGYATEDDFVKTVKQKGWKIIKSGYKVIRSDIVNPNVKGYIVSGIPLQKLDSAVFWFFKGVLFEVNYTFTETMNKSTFYTYYDLLRKKYGSPEMYTRPHLSDGRAKWSKGDVLIELHAPWARPNTYLEYVNLTVWDEAANSDDEIYKKEIDKKSKSLEGI